MWWRGHVRPRIITGTYGAESLNHILDKFTVQNLTIKSTVCSHNIRGFSNEISLANLPILANFPKFICLILPNFKVS